MGQPGEWESLIPVWGSGRAAVDHFQNGNIWRGLGHSALAISDVFLIKSIATAVGKGVVIGSSKIAAGQISNRAFHSGVGSEARAIADGFQTLGQTRAGQNLAKLTAGMEYAPGTEAYIMWSRLSTVYAKGVAPGSSINVYLNNPSSLGIWNQVEKRILQSKGININTL